MSDCAIRLVEEKDIPILYEHHKEFINTPGASLSKKPLPSYPESRAYVLKYLYVNEHHLYDKWYIIEDSNKNILGNCFLTKNVPPYYSNDMAYHVLKKYQRQGIASCAVKKMMDENPRKKYNITINYENKPSLRFAEKLGFQIERVTYTNEL